MRVAPVLFVGLFIGMASCGSGPDVPEDTAGVSSETPPSGPLASIPPTPDEAAPATTGDPPAPPGHGPVVPSGDDRVAIGFAAHERFVVFANPGASSFVVFDREDNGAFRVLGAPTGSAIDSSDSLASFGAASFAQRLLLDEDGQGQLLVRSPGGVQLVDLRDHGRMVAAWRGVARAVSLAPDAAMFAAVADDGVHLVRTSDSAHALRGAPPGSDEAVAIVWSERFVSWSSQGRVTRVERETFRSASFASDEGVAVATATSTRADVVAIASKPSQDLDAPSTAIVFVEGKSAPLRFKSPSIEQLAVDPEGATVAWVERVSDAGSATDLAFMHTVDIASGVHARFRMKGSGCQIAPEVMEHVRAGTIVTDASCSLGCPSVRWSHRAVTYDARSGKVLSDVSTTEQKSWNEEQDEALEQVQRVVAKLGGELDAAARTPRRDAVFFAKPTFVGIASLAEPDRRIELEASADLSLAGLVSSGDGGLVAGVVAGRARVWDGATGRALLR